LSAARAPTRGRERDAAEDEEISADDVDGGKAVGERRRDEQHVLRADRPRHLCVLAPVALRAPLRRRIRPRRREGDLVVHEIRRRQGRPGVRHWNERRAAQLAEHRDARVDLAVQQPGQALQPRDVGVPEQLGLELRRLFQLAERRIDDPGLESRHDRHVHDRQRARDEQKENQAQLDREAPGRRSHQRSRKR
jgi:hypothetical protein